MNLSAEFFEWPFGQDLGPAIDELMPIFQASVLKPYAQPNPSGNIVELIALLCREWGINPWWVVISGQREQGIFTRSDLPLDVSNAWLGYVGQDQGRSKLPGYYGLYTQLERMVPQTAWYLGKLPIEAWAEHADKNLDLRFKPGMEISIMQPDGTWKNEVIDDAGLCVQYQYTPHYQTPHENLGCALEVKVPVKYLNA